MKVDVWCPEGSFKDMQKKIADVLQAVVESTDTSKLDGKTLFFIESQTGASLKDLAKQVGGQDAKVLKVHTGGNCKQAVESRKRGEIQGYVDIGVRFYFTTLPKITKVDGPPENVEFSTTKAPVVTPGSELKPDTVEPVDERPGHRHDDGPDFRDTTPDHHTPGHLP